MKLQEMVTSIQTKADFVAFVEALEDHLETDPKAWKHTSLDDYIEAIGDWVEDMEDTLPQEPTWQIVAKMLLAASQYE
ncbi:hypothetical protein IC620_10125 [Hazenella sp. IB182357]|uniref:DUF7660 domain-containing protein n=1 Tax=Polycladospora coralii TaxID=2771432 RepID=A0A926NA59_9BACL|nr:hypothetical protein [Polycladospora coralii]MBD1372712.1 hypothetical protein [Polycladospora coralii]